jgi:hypothetical protein
VHLVGFTIEMYYDARSYKRQKTAYYFLGRNFAYGISLKIHQVLHEQATNITTVRTVADFLLWSLSHSWV